MAVTNLSQDNTNQKRAFIIDCCFGQMTGHWENYCKRLYRELMNRNYTVKVFGQIDPIDEIVGKVAFAPIFTQTPYVEMENTLRFKQRTQDYLEDLQKIDINEFQEGDLLIFHSIFPQVLSAFAIWLKTFAVKKKIRAAIFFQFPPSQIKSQASWLKKFYLSLRNIKNNTRNNPALEWVENMTVRFYQACIPDLAGLIAQRALVLMASTETLSNNFTQLFGLPVHYLPMPGPVHAHIKEKPYVAGETIKIGYFGHSSLDKGGQFLPYIVKSALLLFADVKFILHINPNHETEKYLQSFKGVQSPQIECYYGHLEQEQMLTLIKDVDIILMPYSFSKYASTPSAILCEALPLQKVFILPKDSWAHKEAKKCDGGFNVFKRHNDRAVFKALCGAIKNFAELKNKSISAGKKYYKEHNMQNYLDVIETIISKEWSV